MNDIEELRRFAEVHARAQGIAGYQAVLARIENDENGTPASWSRQWSAAGDALKLQGRHLQAASHYIMARFPFVDGDARQAALDNAVLCCERWAPRHGVGRIEFEVAGVPVRAWGSGLSAARRKPLLLVMGGIVSVKEQWVQVLTRIGSFGLAGVVAEMPGVGENRLRYDAESWRLIPALLDAVADRADVSQTYALALSFSGHLALRAAVEDERIRGVVTAGAPVSEFFNNPVWLHRVPSVTLDTLAHLTGVPREQLPGYLGDWGLKPDELQKIEVPVAYLNSRRDEIIPQREAVLLREYLRGPLTLVENDDVHGSPAHSAESRFWTVLTVQRMRGIRDGQTRLLDLLVRLARRRSASAARKAVAS